MADNLNSIYTDISSLDSMKQERLSLREKYRSHSIDFDNPEIAKLFGGANPNTTGTSPNLAETVGKSNFLDVCMSLGNDEAVKKLYLISQMSQKSFSVNQAKRSIDPILEMKPDKKAYGVEELRNKGLKNKLQALGAGFQLSLDLFFRDLLRYHVLNSQLESKGAQKQDLAGVEIPLEHLQTGYQNTVLSLLRNNRRKEKYGKANYDGEVDPAVWEMLGLQNADVAEHSPEFNQLVWKYDFFRIVRKSVEKGYILTYRDHMMIKEIVDDLRMGEVVLLTGDTGSGKTELARFICKNYLNTDYVFVPSSRDLEVADMTLEKVITSRSPFGGSDGEIIVQEEKNNDELLKKKAKMIVESLLKKEEICSLALTFAGEDQDAKNKITEFFKNLDISKHSLVTEYHAMGIFKAAELGIPVIVDEVNLVRPEIFMAMNDYLTRRIGQPIQLPNALGEIVVKKGFCIILTGNDPEQNSKSKKYENRFRFDEATYNRLTVYAKNYANQTEEKFNENLLEDRDKGLDYLLSNEMYSLVLMMISGIDSEIMKNSKFGFEVMKRNFEGKSLGKAEFFEQMEHFALAISYIQKVFSEQKLPTDHRDDARFATLPLSAMIKREVFSMRNLKKVLSRYKQGILPLEYHLYQEFVSHVSNEDAQYALLVIFHRFGFFRPLVTDNQEATRSNVHRKMLELKRNDAIKKDDVAGKISITNQDLLKEYFGSFTIPDEAFAKNSDRFQLPVVAETLWEEEEKGENENANEVSVEDFVNCQEALTRLVVDKGADLNITEMLSISFLITWLSNLVKSFESKEKSLLNKIRSGLYRLINALNRLGTEEGVESEIGELVTELSGAFRAN